MVDVDVETLDKFDGDTTMGGGMSYFFSMFADPGIINILRLGVSGENGANQRSAFFFSNLVWGVDGLSNNSDKDEMTNAGMSRNEQREYVGMYDDAIDAFSFSSGININGDRVEELAHIPGRYAMSWCCCGCCFLTSIRILILHLW